MSLGPIDPVLPPQQLLLFPLLLPGQWSRPIPLLLPRLVPLLPRLVPLLPLPIPLLVPLLVPQLLQVQLPLLLLPAPFYVCFC
jgi:hypothetical protein